MRYDCDRLGTPWLRVPGMRVGLALHPLLKVQFERFLSEPGEPPEGLYAELLAVHPRSSWRAPDPARPEGVVLTGLTPADLVGYLAFTGEGMRLPDAAEWRALDAALGDAPVPAEWLRGILADAAVSPVSRHLVRLTARAVPGVTWRRLAMLSDGVLEWVQTPTGPGLLGRTRPAFHKVILNPAIHAPLVPIAGARHKAFGVRLARPAPTGDAV